MIQIKANLNLVQIRIVGVDSLLFLILLLLSRSYDTMVNLNSTHTRYNYYLGLQITQAAVMNISEAAYDLLPRAHLISMHLNAYPFSHHRCFNTDDEANAQAWLNIALIGIPGIPIPALSPEAVAFGLGLAPHLSAKERMMLVMERPDVSNEEIASVGF